MQAVILAGGLGTRLRPFTKEAPKSMVHVCGRPYLEYQIRWLKSHGIENILLLIGYLGEKIKEHFGNGSSFGVNINYSQEPEPLGTGGGLRLSSDKLEAAFILIYGDSFLPVDFLPLTRHFHDIDRKGLVVIYDNSIFDSGVMNNIQMDKDGVILKYIKNSKDKNLNFVEAGVMVFKKEIVNLIPENKRVSLEEEVFSALIENRELAGYVSKEVFYDIGTKERLCRFEDMLRGNIFGLNKI